MSLKLHFLRHGQTPFSRDDTFCGAGLDPELTLEGVAMAHAFAAAYQATPWAAVYASPLRRAIMTAQPLCDAVGIKMELRDDLQEIHYGRWEGKTAEMVEHEYHDDYIRWSADPAWNAPSEGEPAVAIAHRSLRAVEETIMGATCWWFRTKPPYALCSAVCWVSTSDVFAIAWVVRWVP